MKGLPGTGFFVEENTESGACLSAGKGKEGRPEFSGMAAKGMEILNRGSFSQKIQHFNEQCYRLLLKRQSQPTSP